MFSFPGYIAAGRRLPAGSPGYQSINCELGIFLDEADAYHVFTATCGQGNPPLAFPDVGQEACSFGAGVVTLYLWRAEEALVVIKADSWGAGLLSLAKKVAARLQ